MAEPINGGAEQGGSRKKPTQKFKTLRNRVSDNVPAESAEFLNRLAAAPNASLDDYASAHQGNQASSSRDYFNEMGHLRERLSDQLSSMQDFADDDSPSAIAAGTGASRAQKNEIFARVHNLLDEANKHEVAARAAHYGGLKAPEVKFNAKSYDQANELADSPRGNDAITASDSALANSPASHLHAAAHTLGLASHIMQVYSGATGGAYKNRVGAFGSVGDVGVSIARHYGITHGDLTPEQRSTLVPDHAASEFGSYEDSMRHQQAVYDYLNFGSTRRPVEGTKYDFSRAISTGDLPTREQQLADLASERETLEAALKKHTDFNAKSEAIAARRTAGIQARGRVKDATQRASWSVPTPGAAGSSPGAADSYKAIMDVRNSMEPAVSALISDDPKKHAQLKESWGRALTALHGHAVSVALNGQAKSLATRMQTAVGHLKNVAKYIKDGESYDTLNEEGHNYTGKVLGEAGYFVHDTSDGLKAGSTPPSGGYVSHSVDPSFGTNSSIYDEQMRKKAKNPEVTDLYSIPESATPMLHNMTTGTVHPLSFDTIPAGNYRTLLWDGSKMHIPSFKKASFKAADYTPNTEQDLDDASLKTILAKKAQAKENLAAKAENRLPNTMVSSDNIGRFTLRPIADEGTEMTVSPHTGLFTLHKPGVVHTLAHTSFDTRDINTTGGLGVGGLVKVGESLEPVLRTYKPGDRWNPFALTDESPMINLEQTPSPQASAPFKHPGMTYSFGVHDARGRTQPVVLRGPAIEPEGDQTSLLPGLEKDLAAASGQEKSVSSAIAALQAKYPELHNKLFGGKSDTATPNPTTPAEQAYVKAMGALLRRRDIRSGEVAGAGKRVATEVNRIERQAPRGQSRSYAFLASAAGHMTPTDGSEPQPITIASNSPFEMYAYGVKPALKGRSSGSVFTSAEDAEAEDMADKLRANVGSVGKSDLDDEGNYAKGDEKSSVGVNRDRSRKSSESNVEIEQQRPDDTEKTSEAIQYGVAAPEPKSRGSKLRDEFGY